MRFLSLIIALMCLVSTPAKADNMPAYWLWAGHSIADIPEASVLYIYQGNIRSIDEKLRFESKGVHPHPLGARPIMLVFRLYGSFPDTQQLARLTKNLAKRWEKHGAKVIGVQLDFDAATSKLDQYADFLELARQALPPELRLSITGLGDWTTLENPTPLKRLTTIADEVVFQMYQGATAFPDKTNYIAALEKTGIPYKLGLLASDDFAYIETSLQKSPAFKGIILFPDAKP